MTSDLPALVSALRDAIEAGQGHLPASDLDEASRLLAKAGARGALGDATVVALAGATGSGKSTLFNALAGESLSETGVRRPTTGVTHAAVWGQTEGAAPLLDWLQVARRHHVSPDADLDGLVLLDLPDHDSTAAEHRLEVDRLVELVDVLVWVLDPQKYADAAVHDRYLKPYAEYAGVLLVVLNQADRLGEGEAKRVTGDLRRLLDDEGLEAVPVLAASARTGLGLPELRAEIARRVAERRAASERLAADIRVTGTHLGEHCGGGEAGEVSRADRTALIDALAGAAGVPVVTSAVERSVRSRGVAETGWPPIRWLSGWRADPLRRLRLGQANPGQGRTSLPGPSRPQEAALSSALRRVRDASADGLPEAWRDDLRTALADSEHRLADRLDQAVAGADLDAERPAAWWRVIGGLQWLLLLVTFLGALWLLGLAGLAYLQLDDVLPPPRIEGIPLPTLLLGAGLLAGLLLSVLCRPFVAAGARRRARRAERRMHDRISEVADASVLAPLESVRAAYRRYCDAVARLGGDKRR